MRASLTEVEIPLLPLVADRAIRLPASFLILFEFVILFVRDWFEPFVGCLFSRNLESQMCKPTVGCRSVPMLHVSRDMDDRTG